ncbi:MAG: DinB family protein [Candidatus Latescibacterota bacterium]|nr:MAG: DinB family protein [Candidatus Latescibacterota bacterium]
MEFELRSARDILARTPVVLTSLLQDLPDKWARQNEGPGTWSPFDIVGHLIHGELTDWIPRTRIILEHGAGKTFEPFDRFAQFEASKGKSLNQLLEEFTTLRKSSLIALDELDLATEHLELEGRHPDLGVVTLRQTLSTWVVHDLGHIGQIVRTMAKRYASEVGPWVAHLRVLEG